MFSFMLLALELLVPSLVTGASRNHHHAALLGISESLQKESEVALREHHARRRAGEEGWVPMSPCAFGSLPGTWDGSTWTLLSPTCQLQPLLKTTCGGEDDHQSASQTPPSAAAVRDSSRILMVGGEGDRELLMVLSAAHRYGSSVKHVPMDADRSDGELEGRRGESTVLLMPCSRTVWVHLPMQLTGETVTDRRNRL